jgi:hypothetical protein
VLVKNLEGKNMNEIKDFYNHESSPSVFVMFDNKYQAHWCYSGNELRRIYLEDPSMWLNGPLELPITKELDEKLTAMYDNYYAFCFITSAPIGS